MNMNASTESGRFLALAVEIAAANVRNNGGPFGAVIVTTDGRVFEGSNRVTATNDPTAHAEVTAIRNACSELGTFDLRGCTLYSSCEPCPMCLASALWARIDRVVYAADRHDAALAGFNDAVFYDYFESPAEERLMPVVREVSSKVDHALPFDIWNRLGTRTEY